MAYNSAYTGEQIDAAVGAVRQKESTWDNKQAALTGTQGQFVGFGAEGNPTPKGVMAGDVKFSDGQTFQQKYDSGELTGPTGPAGAPGDPGQPGAPGAAGTPATINGVNALTIQAGGNVQMSQEGGVVTISAKITGRGVVLPASGWVDGVQTVSVTGVPADENTFRAAYTYPGTSAAAIASAAPMITGTGLNSVTFTCTGETPTEDLVVYVEITEAVYVAPPIVMISFTIDGTSYQAEQGMTWYEWCQSEYNTGDWMVSGANQVTSPSRNVYISGVNQNDVISANAAYSSIVGGGSGN